MICRKPLLTVAILAICFQLASCAGLTQSANHDQVSSAAPLVIMISGKSGKLLYFEFVKRLKCQGYRVVLLDGNDFPVDQPAACEAKILKTIKRHTDTTSGKAIVIGYSLGGAVALSCAGALSENVAGIIAYYPATRFIADLDACLARLSVPVRIFQGEEDRYYDCCKVETIRSMQEKAIKKGRVMDLTVYPQAGHGFNLGPMKNENLDGDSWRKTLEAMDRFLLRP